MVILGIVVASFLAHCVAMGAVSEWCYKETQMDRVESAIAGFFWPAAVPYQLGRCMFKAVLYKIETRNERAALPEAVCLKDRG